MICPICHSKNTAVRFPKVSSVYSGHPYDISHCNDCNHYYTDPAPSATELDDIYNNKYSYDAHALIEGEKTMRAKHYANYIASRNLGKSVLEVGCMHGLLLTALKAHRIEVEGVELDGEAVKFCKSQGLNVQQSSVENYLEASPNSHDVIVMSHVIEHIADPEAQLKGLGTKLNPNGSLVLITPNSATATRTLFGRYWGYWQVPVHINRFNRSSIAKLLERSGFEISEIKYFGGDSLFFLSSLANLLGASNDSKKLTPAKKLLVRICTIILLPWFYIGSEDMLVVARKA